MSARTHGWHGPRVRYLALMAAVAVALALVPLVGMAQPEPVEDPSDACPDETNPPAPFVDRLDIPEVHRLNVDCAFNNDITLGFTDQTFRPRLIVPRDQFASFMVRTLQAADVELPEASDQGFTDIEGNTHERSIGCILWWDITASSSTYRPSEGVTRGQMATFIAQALEAAGVSLPSVTSSSFTDAQSNIHEKRIAQLAELRIVGGYSDGTYRPNAAVTRNQMATFLVRAYETAWDQTLQAGGTSFTDIGSDAHRTNIEKAARAGFASGTSTTTFSPGDEVARAQMATFLRNVLDLAVSEGFTAPPNAR